MTASGRSIVLSVAAQPAHLGAPLTLLLGLAGIVGLRWLAMRVGLDGLVVGAAFGAALVGLWRIGSSLRSSDVVRWARPKPGLGRWARGLAVGVFVGLALVAVAIAGPALAGIGAVPGLGRQPVAFVPWAAITVLVGTAEELVLRGVLFERLERAGGVAIALAVTTLAFALMHVPAYGWQVVPLDLAVGLALGGLRLVTRTVAAPAAAHVVADLATWWL